MQDVEIELAQNTVNILDRCAAGDFDKAALERRCTPRQIVAATIVEMCRQAFTGTWGDDKPTGQPGDEDVRIGGVADELDDRRSTVDRITWNALLDGMDMDDQLSLTKELESWAGGNACDAIEYTPDSVGRLDSESSPSPANNG